MGGIDGGNIVRHQVYGSNSVFKPREKAKTNADRIRAMSDDELCDLLDEWWCMGANNDERLAYADERLAWLQQSAAEEKEGSDNA